MAEIRESMQTHAAGVELLGYRYEVGELAANEVEIRISHCGMPLRTCGASPASRIDVLASVNWDIWLCNSRASSAQRSPERFPMSRVNEASQSP
jgi:hypothetical protein